VVDIVLNGTYLCSREFARRLIPTGRAGSIVKVGASYSWTGSLGLDREPGFAHSAAAKAGSSDWGAARSASRPLPDRPDPGITARTRSARGMSSRKPFFR